MTLGAVDLFCGVGGLTLGLEQSGINVVAGIDSDPSCAFPYSYNNSSNFIGARIEDVSGREIRSYLKGFDYKLLVGCAPCQPFSKHQKDKKDRSSHKSWNLLSEFGRLILEVRPSIVSMENVPGLVTEEVFDRFIKLLISKSYHINYKVVNVADYGVPQTRRRLILLASKLGPIELVQETHRENPVSVKEAIGNLPPISDGCQDVYDPLHYSSKLSALNKQRMSFAKPGGTWHDWPDHLISACHQKKTGKSYSAVYGRMKWSSPAPTITTEFTYFGTGRFGHPEQNRALSLREGAILQSFPRSYMFVPNGHKVSIKEISRQIGNAVPPRLGEIIGESIINHLKKNSK